MDALDYTLFLRALAPVRHCLHRLLDDADAARLLRVSRTVSAAVLPGFTFASHVFRPADAEGVRSMSALYERYGLRVTRMSLPYDFDEPLQDAENGASLLPSSLQALVMGEVDASRQANSLFAHIAALETSEEQSPVGQSGQSDEFLRLLHRVHSSTSWRVEPASAANGSFTQFIPPGALPAGLRFLQLPHDYSVALASGSIPSSVEFLQFGYHFKKPIGLGVLPPRLQRLILGFGAPEAFVPGELPLSLQYLHLGSYNSPLQPNVLPPSLKGLDLGERFNHPLPPSVVPPSVTHLRLSDFFNRLLVRGSIPDSVVHLNLGDCDQRLDPGVLPSSLRELLFSRNFTQNLAPGVLPHGVEVVSFPVGYVRELGPGVLPASVVFVDLNSFDGHLAGGAIPESVKWLRLPSRYKPFAEQVIPRTTEVHWTLNHH